MSLLLEQLRFERIIPGVYSPESSQHLLFNSPPGFPDSKGPAVRRVSTTKSLAFPKPPRSAKGTFSLDDELFSPRNRGLEPQGLVPEYQEDSLNLPGEEAFIGEIDEFQIGEMEELDVPSVGAASATKPAESRPADIKPEAILQLEQILSQEYRTPIAITRVRDLSQTRKQVREVFFIKNNSLSKVWVFKADPASTARELARYYIIHAQGVPTAKPIGFRPSPGSITQSYPYDIAILGGIVEDAGGPYREMIANMQLKPEYIFQTAGSIARMIAGMHKALTKAGDVFARYNIEIPAASPRRELRERLLAALPLEESQLEPLIKACEQLYAAQSGEKVISHGDFHLGNITTVLERNGSTSLNRFGAIDWGSLMLDYPSADLVDFWIHHQREAKGVCQQYPYELGELAAAYNQHLERSERIWATSEEKLLGQNTAIQTVLWHLYEMYDPTRTTDKEQKALYHYLELKRALEKEELHELRAPIHTLQREITALYQRLHKTKAK